jgi:hypothetical protein
LVVAAGDLKTQALLERKPKLADLVVVARCLALVQQPERLEHLGKVVQAATATHPVGITAAGEAAERVRLDQPVPVVMAGMAEPVLHQVLLGVP